MGPRGHVSTKRIAEIQAQALSLNSSYEFDTIQDEPCDQLHVTFIRLFPHQDTLVIPDLRRLPDERTCTEIDAPPLRRLRKLVLFFVNLRENSTSTLIWPRQWANKCQHTTLMSTSSSSINQYVCLGLESHVDNSLSRRLCDIRYTLKAKSLSERNARISVAADFPNSQ